MSDSSGTNTHGSDSAADDPVADHDAGSSSESTPTQREHAADERTDAAAEPIQPEAS